MSKAPHSSSSSDHSSLSAGSCSSGIGFSSSKECASSKVGLFLASFEIGTGYPGAPCFKLCLTVCTPQETVSGGGCITQAVNPPLDVYTVVNGQYTYLTVTPGGTKILVTAEGCPPVKFPAGGGIGPVILPNVQLRMVLNEDWQTGVAEYKFATESGWHEVKNVPVKCIPSSSLEAAAAA